MENIIKMENSQLFKISKYVFQETFAQSQMDMAGSSQEKILEKMKKNRRYMKIQNIVMKVAMAFISVMLLLFPIIGLNSIDKALKIGNLSQSYLLFTGSLILASFFLMQFIFIVVYGLFFSSSLLSGEQMKWLITLPLTRREIEKINIFTFIRGYDLQILINSLIFPIYMIFRENSSLIIVALSALISILSVIFSLCILIILGKKMHKIMDLNDPNSTKNNRIRMLVMGLWVVILLGISLFMQLGFRYVDGLFEFEKISADTITNLNYIFPIIPFPFAPLYLLMPLYLGVSTPNKNIIYMSVIGTILLLILIQKSYKKAKRNLSESIFDSKVDFDEKRQKTTLEDVKIIIDTPQNAFFKKDKHMASRDIQMFMMVMMPFLLQIVSPIMNSIMPQDETVDIIMMIFSINLIYSIMISTLIVWAILGIESSGATIISTLPILVRDQVNAKIKWLYLILPLSSMVTPLLLMNHPQFWEIFTLTIVLLPLGTLAGILVLEIKVAMFGKLKYKYVIDEVNIEHKAYKWILIIIIDLVIFLAILTALVLFIDAEDQNIANIAIIIGSGEIITTFILKHFYDKLFPKPKIYQ